MFVSSSIFVDFRELRRDVEGVPGICLVCGETPSRICKFSPEPVLLRPPFARREDFSATGSVDSLSRVSVWLSCKPSLTYPDDDIAALPFAFLEPDGAAAEELSVSTLARLARALRGGGVSAASLDGAEFESTAGFFRLREVAGAEWGGGGAGGFGGFSLEEPAEGLADERVTLDDMRF